MTTLCRDCAALTLTAAARNGRCGKWGYRAKSAMPHSIRCRSPTSIATPLMPRSRSTTGRTSPTDRSSSAAVPVVSCSPADTSRGSMACAPQCRCSRRRGGGCGDAAAPRRRRHHADRPARRPLRPGRRAARPCRAQLGRLARVEDARAVDAHAPAHSISAETTLGRDEADAKGLAHALGPLCERLSARLKQASRATGTITLKLKTADFRLRTRSRHLADPT